MENVIFQDPTPFGFCIPLLVIFSGIRNGESENYYDMSNVNKLTPFIFIIILSAMDLHKPHIRNSSTSAAR